MSFRSMFAAMFGKGANRVTEEELVMVDQAAAHDVDLVMDRYADSAQRRMEERLSTMHGDVVGIDYSPATDGSVEAYGDDVIDADFEKKEPWPEAPYKVDEWTADELRAECRLRDVPTGSADRKQEMVKKLNAARRRQLQHA